MTQSVLHTKIIPPPRQARTLARPRVTRLLMQAFDHRLTILQAEAGYGKSTALSELAETVKPLVWYQVNEEDVAPLVFLLHLCHAILYAVPDLTGLPIHFLETWDGSEGPLPWRSVTDQALNALSARLVNPTLLVLDDAHIVTESGEIACIIDRLFGMAPAKLHILLSGRPLITLPTLSRWRSQGEVLEIAQSALTFNAEEIAALFSIHYGLELSGEEASALLTYTEGWAIALQLIWQSVRSQSASAIEFPPHWQTDSLAALFDVLAREVFERQPTDVRDFLLVTSTLRDLRPEACDALRRIAGYAVADSASMLAYLRRQDLFVVGTAGGALRYHHIFHNFLRQQADPEQRRVWNRLAALFLESADKLTEKYIQHGRFAEAIDLAQRVLAHDNCWERAYRHLMQAYAALGDRGQVGRAYQRCVQTLRGELDLDPAPETSALYQQLVGGEKIGS
jgi:ATP/maltotriose-dependent transcriptional regulator MalT